MGEFRVVMGVTTDNYEELVALFREVSLSIERSEVRMTLMPTRSTWSRTGSMHGPTSCSHLLGY